MITTATPVGVGGFGFNPLNAIKSGATSVARTTARVATDPNVQRAAAAGAQAYDPKRYAQAQAYADRARGIFQPPQQQMPAPMPMPMMPMPDPNAPPAGAQKGNIMLFGLIGVGIVAILLMSK